MLLPLHAIATSYESVSTEATSGDELCPVCSKIGFFSFFTGAHHYDGRPEAEEPASAKLGTLAEIRANAKFPLCRLIKHGFDNSCMAGSWAFHNEAEPNFAEAYFTARA